MSVTISVRVEDHIKNDIEDLGYKPGEYLKMILYQEIQKEKSKKALQWLKKHRLNTDGATVEDSIRKDRDSR